MVVTTLTSQPLAEELQRAPSLGAFATTTERKPVPVVRVAPASPLVRFKLLFTTGSAFDPPGKEGLAQLAASVVTDSGSKRQRIDEINRALFPLAATFTAQVDREMTTFTGVSHRENLEAFFDIVLPQLLEPGYREEDFERLKSMQLNALVQDLRSNNEEELGKERLQQLIFTGTPYGHPSLGSVSGIESITLEDVRTFIAANYTVSRLRLGLAGDAPEAAIDRLRNALATLPQVEPAPALTITPKPMAGLAVEIIEKETRSIAISFGHGIEVTRKHPDFAALWLARAWLGEHRASNGRLYTRIREIRGMNYGNYAYIEAFPRGMYQFFPDPNLGRRAQIFEVWVRPVRPEQAVFALKAALYEVRNMVANGIPAEEFEATREYLSKNVFVMTKTQDQQLGYALDAGWYGLPEFTSWMREQLAGLTSERVNEVVRRHLSGGNLQVVMVAANAGGLREQLLSEEPATISYDGSKPAEILEEDRVIGKLPLALTEAAITVTRVEDVFA